MLSVINWLVTVTDMGYKRVYHFGWAVVTVKIIFLIDGPPRIQTICAGKKLNSVQSLVDCENCCYN